MFGSFGNNPQNEHNKEAEENSVDLNKMQKVNITTLKQENQLEEDKNSGRSPKLQVGKYTSSSKDNKEAKKV
jgi:hypothetical protein